MNRLAPVAVLCLLAFSPSVVRADDASSNVVETHASIDAAAESISAMSETGTLLMSKGDCLAVRVYTLSPYTHVAAVVFHDDEPLVYDAMNGPGVRVQPLSDYLQSQCPDRVHMVHPRRRFSRRKSRLFREHLESQLGRSYAVKHHVTGKRTEGIHCAEYVVDALIHAGVACAENPPRVSPASLADGLLEHEIYTPAVTVVVNEPVVEPPVSQSWCSRMWWDTKTCTSNCWRQMGRWFVCR